MINIETKMRITDRLENEGVFDEFIYPFLLKLEDDMDDMEIKLGHSIRDSVILIFVSILIILTPKTLNETFLVLTLSL